MTVGPFFVHTPRNKFGEHLKSQPWSIRSVYELGKEYKLVDAGTEEKKVQEICDELNNEYSGLLMAIFI